MTRQSNICFECKKAYGGCSWSEVDPETGLVRFEPVPGWTAVKRVMRVDHFKSFSREIETYHSTACPLFEKER